jgi:hypothetical protein
MRRGFSLLAVASVGVFLACSDLKRADEEPGQIDPDGGANGDGASSGGDAEDPTIDAAVDVGQPPVDFECSEPWTKEPKLSTQCAPRQVKEIDEGAPDMYDVSIARTPAGRVAVAFFAPQSFDEGEMRFVHFTPATSMYTPKVITRPGNFALQAGYHVKLAASGPDTIHVLAHDVDQQSSGDLIHFRFVDGKEPFTEPPDVVLSALEQKTEVAIAADSVGNVFATARVTTGVKDSGAPIAKLVARSKTVSGAFTPMPDVVTALSPDDAPGVGAASLLFDSAGKQNVIFHYCESATGSQPLYHAFDGNLWSPKKTVDNGSFDGISGFDVRLAVHGSDKIAAFFYRKGGQSDLSATADLRIARWSGAGEVPLAFILDQGIPSPATSTPRHRLAMAVDVYGLVHIATIHPLSPTSGRLDYYRETRVSGGSTKWLRDVIDDDVLGADQDAAVDLVVDEKARPHIAYRSGKDLKVYYVTRYDR